MSPHWRRLATVILFFGLAADAWAGGSGLNVVVVVNQNSTNSVQLGNYYCEKRQVPPQNVLRTSWAGGNIAWQKSDLQSVILTPLQSMLTARGLSSQVDYVLLSMDFPYRVETGGGLGTSGTNSTTSMLFYGFKADYPPNVNPASCSLATAALNTYAASEGIFRQVGPGTSASSFLAAMLTCSNLAQAKLVVDRGLACDGTFPTQTVYLTKSITDVLRNQRYPFFDNTVFDTRVQGICSVQRLNADPSYSLGAILGLQAGWGNPYVVGASTFVPGAMADVFTSWAGILFEYTGQINLIKLLNYGATGSYGTVIEPCAYYQKFASPQNYFYQARGFTMAESYYQSLPYPYQGLLMGDPLAAPFARFPTGSWAGLPADALLVGTTNLSLQLNAADAGHPVQQVDLFIDGTFAQTLTNIAPQNNNVLSVTLDGYPTNYTVPSGATIGSVVTNLALRLNRTSYSNATKVAAFTYGDRIELRSLNRSKTGPQVSVSASSSAGTAPARTAFIAASAPVFLDTVAYGVLGYTNIGSGTNIGDYLRLTITKTNGAVVTLGATNTATGGSLASLAQSIVDQLNAEPALQGSDGVVAEDSIPFNPLTGQPNPQFNLRARSIGWDAAQVQASLSASHSITVQPSGTRTLEQNVADLQPRNHLYVTAGVTNLPLTFAFNTTVQPDGYHELTVVVYEGSHIRTQQRFTQAVRIQNTSLSATFTSLLGDTNTALTATLQFSVVANTGSISKIELFSTGGSLGSAANQSSAVFSVPGTDLGLGLHPFYAVVTATTGKQYRTETKWIRLIGAETPFRVALTAPPPKLTWPATAGRSYEILSATNPGLPFQLTATVTPTNSAGQWTDTNAAVSNRFYRVRSSN